MRNRDDDPYSYIPLELLTTPTDYYSCRLDMWWLVEPGRGALVFRAANAYQCNKDWAVMETIRDGRLLDIVFVPIAYVPPSYNW